MQQFCFKFKRAKTGKGVVHRVLESFGQRVGNTWSPAQTAVANALPEGARLEEGQLLKVALPEPYRGQ